MAPFSRGQRGLGDDPEGTLKGKFKEAAEMKHEKRSWGPSAAQHHATIQRQAAEDTQTSREQAIADRRLADDLAERIGTRLPTGGTGFIC